MQFVESAVDNNRNNVFHLDICASFAIARRKLSHLASIFLSNSRFWYKLQRIFVPRENHRDKRKIKGKRSFPRHL